MSMKSLQGRRTSGSRDECRTAPDGRQPWTKPTDLIGPPLLAAKKLHPASPSLLLSPKADTHLPSQGGYTYASRHYISLDCLL